MTTPSLSSGAPQDLPPLPECFKHPVVHGQLGWILYTADQMRAYVLADRAARPSAVPAGMWLAPMEPTTEMLDRGHHQIDFDRSHQNTEPLVHESHVDELGAGTTIAQDMRDAWAAMRDSWLSRHPAPQQAPEPMTTHPDRVRRLQDAIEGECDGLAITPEHARAILEWVDGAQATPAQAVEANPSIPLSAIRPIAVEAIREVMGCPDVIGTDGKSLTEALEEVARAAAATFRRGAQAVESETAEDAAPEQVFSTSDDEGFTDDFSSMVDSLLTQHETLTPGLVYYIGDKREFVPSDFMRGVTGNILEYASDQAWQEVDEWSEDFANGVKPEALAELQSVVNAWADKHLRCSFWGVKNIREATITEKDVTDHAYLWADTAAPGREGAV